MSKRRYTIRPCVSIHLPCVWVRNDCGPLHELGAAVTLGDCSGVGPDEGALLTLGSLDGDKEGSLEGDELGPELGATETLGVAEGELEGPVEGSDAKAEEGAPLKLGWLEGDEEG